MRDIAQIHFCSYFKPREPLGLFPYCKNNWTRQNSLLHKLKVLTLFKSQYLTIYACHDVFRIHGNKRITRNANAGTQVKMFERKIQ